MKLNLLYQNIRRLCTRRMFVSFLITTILCSIACIVFTRMNRSLSQASITMLLCGGNIYENEFAFRCSIWLLPAYVFTLNIGKSIEDERQCYRYIAIREGNGVQWFILESLTLLLIAMSCSATLILVPSAMMVIQNCRYWNMSEIISTISGQITLADIWQLWIVNILRLTRSGVIQLWCMTGRRYTAQIGLLLVLLIELLTFFNVIQQYAFFSFSTVFYGVADIKRIMVQGCIYLSIIFAMGMHSFRTAMINGEM